MVDKIPPEKIRLMHQLFDELKNEDNEVEYRHLQTMINKLGHDPDVAQMETVYQTLDVYCNGKFSFAHFLNMFAAMFVNEEGEGEKEKTEEDDALEEEMKEAFRVFDGDGNGFISQAELKHTLHKMGERLTDEEIEDMMNEADTDGDGQVSFKEFCRMMELSWGETSFVYL